MWWEAHPWSPLLASWEGVTENLCHFSPLTSCSWIWRIGTIIQKKYKVHLRQTSLMLWDNFVNRSEVSDYIENIIALLSIVSYIRSEKSQWFQNNMWFIDWIGKPQTQEGVRAIPILYKRGVLIRCTVFFLCHVCVANGASVGTRWYLINGLDATFSRCKSPLPVSNTVPSSFYIYTLWPY